MQFRNILVRSTNWVGDAVMSLPALQLLRQYQPTARISVLAKPSVASLYSREPFCDEVISYPSTKSWSAKYTVAGLLRKHRFDCALLLQNAFEAAAIAWLGGIPVRIGYNRDGRKFLLTKAISVPSAMEIPKHQRFYYLELLKRAELISGYSADSEVRMTGADQAAIAGKRYLEALTGNQSFIGIGPGAAYGGAKRWLPERFAEAAVELAKQFESAVVILGVAADTEICQQVEKKVTAGGVRCVNLAEKTTLGLLIEITAACRLLLANDSGIMHIGSALGVPTVSIFGPTDEHATGPTGSLARVVRKSVECSPCLLRECPIDHRCMTRVGVDLVVTAALEVTDGR